MDKKWYSAECLGDSVIALGKVGEGEAVRVEIDVSEWAAAYPYAEIKLFVKPPKPGAPYFARIDGPQDGMIGWTLKKSDTQHAGGGVIELMLISGEEVLLKSATARTELLPSPSMGGASDGPPEANGAWWEEALEKIDAAKQEAIQSVGTLAGTATTAAEKAEEAAAKAEAANENIEETVTDLRNDIDALADTIAILHAGVPDTSAKAASHELYATDAPMNVTLYGQTYQAGEGDPSPDNVRQISGVDVAKVHCGGKNLIDFPENQSINKSTLDSNPIVLEPNLADGQYVLSWSITSSGGANKIITVTYADGRTASGYAGGSSLKLSGAVKSISVINWTGNDQTINWMQLEAGTVKTDYEPYNANVIDMTAALNGEALYEDCVVENDVPSGCDEKVVLDGSHTINPATASGYVNVIVSLKKPVLTGNAAILSDAKSDYLPCKTYGDIATGGKIGFALHSTNAAIIVLRIPGLEATAEAYDAYLTEHPLTVYYRSTEYTSENDLRVCKVTRRRARTRIKGSEWDWNTTTDGVWFRSSSLKMYAANDALIACEALKVIPGKSDGISGSDYAIQWYNGNYYPLMIRIKDVSTVEDLKTWLDTNEVYIEYRLPTEEVYMTDPHELRKPTGLMPVTVTGSGETAVEYSCDTKSYIDRKFDALAAALIGG